MGKLLPFLFFCLVSSCLCAKEVVLRVGHFPNMTHAQAMIGHAFSRKGDGWFEKRLGDDVRIEWQLYLAGPSSMEAIFVGSIDMAYTGPNPTINAFVRSEGKLFRIICGSCSGGAALVVQPDGRIKTDRDFKGKKVATPGFGNTQDISCRAWLKSLGYHITMTDGDVLVVPTENPEQLILFQQGVMDAAWTIEPWVSRLILEAKGKLYLEESSLWPETKGKYVTTHLVSTTQLIKEHPDLVKKWVKAHVELTEWIRQHPEEAKKILAEELKNEIHGTLPPEVFDRAWSQLEFTYDPIQLSLQRFAENAYRAGFFKTPPNLKGIYDLSYLEEVLKR